MDKDKIKEFLKSSFGKEKNDRNHSITMLAIYFFFFIILVVFLRVNGGSNDNKKNNKTVIPTVTSSTTNKKEDKKENDNNKNIEINNDINYSYSYTIEYDGETETYLGKKVDDKEKFTYSKNEITEEYAILDGNYLKYDGNKYVIIDRLNTYFKYCNVEKIISLLEEEKMISNNNISLFNITNKKIADTYKELLLNDNNNTNSIQVVIENNNLKTIELDLSNYITSLLDENHILKINMTFVNVGTTEAFDIKIN